VIDNRKFLVVRHLMLFFCEPVSEEVPKRVNGFGAGDRVLLGD
jgi:hypothetical protein